MQLEISASWPVAYQLLSDAQSCEYKSERYGKRVNILCLLWQTTDWLVISDEWPPGEIATARNTYNNLRVPKTACTI